MPSAFSLLADISERLAWFGKQKRRVELNHTIATANKTDLRLQN
jgi:hypothetical protein